MLFSKAKAGTWPRGTRLVLGPSSIGKSTYIERWLSDHVPVFGHQLANPSFAPPNRGPVAIHYNMLHPFNNGIELIGKSLPPEAGIDAVTKSVPRLTADILVARPRTLARRAIARTTLEPLFGDPSAYNALHFFEIAMLTDIVGLYRRWVAYLDERAIPYRFVSVETEPIMLASRAAAEQILNDRSPSCYSQDEAERAINLVKSDYQLFEPGGVAAGAAAADRRPTFDIVAAALSDGSVLDIGCGEGFFSLNLAKLGHRVVATELKRERLLTALVLGELAGTTATFHRQDLLAGGGDEKFDNVLLLNVLHHVPDLIGALRAAANMTLKTLIVEFVMPSDSKFLASGTLRPVADDEPYIGVSDLGGQDQTFVFTSEAFRRLVTVNNPWFRTIEFVPSPMSESRRIAICRK